MTVLHAGEIGRFDELAPLIGTDSLLILQDGVLFQMPSSEADTFLKIFNTVAKTANYTAVIEDDVILVDATSGAVTISLFTAVGNLGRQITVKKVDSSGNAVITDPFGSETIDGEDSATISIQFTALTYNSDGTNWGIV